MTLRARIYSGFALLLASLVVVGTIVVVAQRNRLIDQLDEQLMTVAPLNRGTPRPPGNAAPTGSPNATTQEAPISDLYIATITPNGNVETVVQGQLLDDVPEIDASLISAALVTVSSADGAPVSRFATLDAVDGSASFRALIEPSAVNGPTAVIALPMDDVNDSVRQLTITLGLLAAFAAGLLGLLALWIARLGLKPISEMTLAATAIAAGDREQRVPQQDPRTEAGQLSAAFNEMLDQRDGAEDRLRRFVSDASHELRTPLTSVSGYLDVYSQGGFRGPGQLDDAVRRMQSEAGRMTSLIEDLLSLARFDEEQALQRSSVDVAMLIGDVVADMSVSHPHRNVVADVAPSIEPVTLDHDKVKQLVLGLVDNALTHAPAATVTIGARRVDGALEVVVADNGPGLSKEQAEHVFERFYRGDPARARTSGGSGLGLAIAQSIAVAHNGSIDLRTADGEGCTFTVRLPAV